MRKYSEHLGRLFILGYKEESPPLYLLNFLQEENIGGTILFKDNCPTHGETKEATTKIKSCYKDFSPFIAVDQEGGRVSRVLEVPAEIDSAYNYATIHGLEKFKEDYQRSMIFLETLGFNINLAPVCDLFINPQNECLKDRCFGKTVDQAIPFIDAAVAISKKAGLLSCLKHFPGLGSSAVDPHKKTALAYYDYDEWHQREFHTFETGITRGADMVMTTHLMLPKFDNEMASSSSKIINNLLRDELAFNGVVITDDLIMDGADELGEVGQRAVKAFNAGHDLLLFSQDTDQAMEAYEYFRQAYLHDEISDERIKAALERISSLKFKLTGSFSF